jgi:hypothetical protein
VLATSAFADTRLGEIRTHAGQVQKGSEQVTLLLKAKQPDAQAIQGKISAMGGDIENLQRLIVGLTEANPQFIQRGDKDWDLLKQQVQLLSIFHNTKQELTKADDLRKNRSLLRAHAKGLTTRAGSLQETAQRLQR